MKTLFLYGSKIRPASKYIGLCSVSGICCNNYVYISYVTLEFLHLRVQCLELALISNGSS